MINCVNPLPIIFLKTGFRCMQECASFQQRWYEKCRKYSKVLNGKLRPSRTPKNRGLYPTPSTASIPPFPQPLSHPFRLPFSHEKMERKWPHLLIRCLRADGNTRQESFTDSILHAGRPPGSALVYPSPPGCPADPLRYFWVTMSFPRWLLFQWQLLFDWAPTDNCMKEKLNQNGQLH